MRQKDASRQLLLSAETLLGIMAKISQTNLYMELAKSLFTFLSTIIGLLAFIKGVMEFVHLNSIRRYEKFHQMSTRFDENEDIQKVCALLHDANNELETVSIQQKEVFICFIEEVYFMMNSGLMNRDLALYSFGYYGKLAIDSEAFWQGLNKNEVFYIHFLDFCHLARSYRPKPSMRKEKFAF